jgi:mono/diheme cytochrome c family protein
MNLPQSLSLLLLFLLPFVSLGQVPAYSTDQGILRNGQETFNANCVSCHGIDEGAFGPKLGGVTTVRSLRELIDFTRNPQKFVDKADERTVALVSEYKSVMPAFEQLTDAELASIFSFIESETKKKNSQPKVVKAFSGKNNDLSFCPPVLQSSLWIELEGFAQIPRQQNSPDDKGVATLRTDPNSTGDLFASDQIGLIYRIHDRNPYLYLDIRKELDDFIFSPGIGTGLGSFDFHPLFKQNGLLYTTHAEKYTGKVALNAGAWNDTIGVGLQWVLTEWKTDLPQATLFKGTKREVFRINTPTTAHGMQDITFAPGLSPSNPDFGMLYIGIGDGGSNNIRLPELCHDPGSLLGVIIRIDPLATNGQNRSYGYPPDNPFVKRKVLGAQKEIYAYGFRNPHRMAWDEANGNRLLVADIGEANVEEVNIVVNGGDYGWSSQEGLYGVNTRIDKTVLFELSDVQKQKINLPFGQYDHSDGNAISGGFIYEGPLSVLAGKYVFGDIVTGRLFYMNIDPAISDSTIYAINLANQGKESSMRELSGQKRVHLRIGYDRATKELFLTTKKEGMIRKVSNAYLKN